MAFGEALDFSGILNSLKSFDDSDIFRRGAFIWNNISFRNEIAESGIAVGEIDIGLAVEFTAVLGDILIRL